MIVFAEAVEQMAPSASLRDLRAGTEAARLIGAHIVSIPPDFAECSARNALAHLPAPRFASDAATPAVWLGYIPDLERYQALYESARELNISLVNTPREHQRAQEADAWLPLLEGLTPRSVVVKSVNECDVAAREVGLPAFVKGAVQSRKARGWRACVADNLDELRARTDELLQLEARSRGRVIVRELARLRFSRRVNDFPMGREYRVFLWRETVLATGYYWEGEDDLKALSGDEQNAVETLACESARRLKVPYLAVDIGQCEDGRWIIIEVGDAQFCGLCQIPPLSLWHKLRVAVESY